MAKQTGTHSTAPRIPRVDVPDLKERGDGSTIPPAIVVHVHPIKYATVDPKTGRAGK